MPRTDDPPTDAPGDGRDLPEAVRAATPEGPPYGCRYCDRRFTRADYLALHWGLDHPEDLAGDERGAHEAARERETEQLRLFRLKALGALVLLYFGFLMVFALATG